VEEEEEDDEEEDDEEEEEEEEEEEDEVSIVLGLKAVLYSLKHKKITIARARAGQSIQSPTMEWRGYERLQESMRLACDVLSLAPELAACLSFFCLIHPDYGCTAKRGLHPGLNSNHTQE